MTIPKRIKVGPLRYNIAYQSPIFDDGNVRLSGQCRHSELRILIDDTNVAGLKYETFIHEALHAIDYVAGTELSEEQVSRLSMVLTAFLIDNGFVKDKAA